MNKYRNQKVMTPHGTFDSKREYRRYQELLLLQRAGKISELRRQVKYELLPSLSKTDTVEIASAKTDESDYESLSTAFSPDGK